MVRYDQTDIKKDIEDTSAKELITIDLKHMQKIVQLFKKEISELEVNNVYIVKNITKDTIAMNDKVNLNMLIDKLGTVVDSKAEFIKNFYMYRLDGYINEAYGKPVTAIQEFPYSFNTGNNENIIKFEFIV